MTNFPTLTAAIDRMTQEDITDGLITCAAIQVVCKNKTVYKRNHGFADADKNIPLSDHHLFRMASMTKPVTAVCIMIQIERGKLSLDDPASKYLPQLSEMQVAEVDREGNLIGTHPAPYDFTVRDLLTHSSGRGSGAWFGKFCRNTGFAAGDTLA